MESSGTAEPTNPEAAPEKVLDHEKKIEDSADQMDEDLSSNDGSDVEVDEKTLKCLAELESKIRSNPAAYDAHVDYIALLVKSKLFNKAQIARKAMQSQFPLSEELWMELLEAEMELAQTSNDLVELMALFDLAVKDYLSVDLWNQYLEFTIGCIPAVTNMLPEGLVKFRALAERALASCGLHVKRGHVIWKTYIKFEIGVEAVQEENEKNAQVEVIRKLYHRALGVPLAEQKSIMAEWKAWEAAHDVLEKQLPESVFEVFKDAKEMLEIRASFEEQIGEEGSVVNERVLAVFLAYIRLEEAQNIPARAICLYERAVAVFPINSSLWMKYAHYVEIQVKSFEVVRNVYERAQRNLPWVGEVWAETIRSYERLDQDIDEIRSVCKKALAAGLQGPEEYMTVLLAWLDVVRVLKVSKREEGRPGFVPMEVVRQEFARAMEVMGSYFPEYMDKSHRIPAYWADCEISFGGEDGLERARKIWEDLIATDAKNYYETWSMYAAMEFRAKAFPAVRKLYKKAVCKEILKGPHRVALCHEWKRFEREHGTSVSYMKSAVNFDPVLAEATWNHDSFCIDAIEKAISSVPTLTPEQHKSLKRKALRAGEGRKQQKKEKSETPNQGAEEASTAEDNSTAGAERKAEDRGGDRLGENRGRGRGRGRHDQRDHGRRGRGEFRGRGRGRGDYHGRGRGGYAGRGREGGEYGRWGRGRGRRGRGRGAGIGFVEIGANKSAGEGGLSNDDFRKMLE
ncbi:hypothetical protein BSKO_00066 [Bryopsis sp. KO-2023]|nr:hypothetical protein BSKO_00066 [Bryopsis sp. KO-2023]